MSHTHFTIDERESILGFLALGLSKSEIAKKLGVLCYFANPYHSWERGTNENTNGLIRRYFPKGTDFKTLTKEEVNKVVWAINNRPRKTLGFRTPLEIFRCESNVAFNLIM